VLAPDPRAARREHLCGFPVPFARPSPRKVAAGQSQSIHPKKRRMIFSAMAFPDPHGKKSLKLGVIVKKNSFYICALCVH